MNTLIVKIRQHALSIALIQAWVATLGSLYFSEIRHFAPCLLCWYQRILMFPLVIILSVAILRRDEKVAYYVLPLATLGAVIALYHYLIQMTTLATFSPISCGALGSCSQIQALFFGFVTIPLLSLMAFLVILAMMIIILKVSKK